MTPSPVVLIPADLTGNGPDGYGQVCSYQTDPRRIRRDRTYDPFGQSSNYHGNGAGQHQAHAGAPPPTCRGRGSDEGVLPMRHLVCPAGCVCCVGLVAVDFPGGCAALWRWPRRRCRAGRCRPRTGEQYLYVFKGTPSARRAVRPWPGSAQAHGSPRECANRRGCRAAGGRVLGSLAVTRAAAWPAASSAAAHRRGPLPPRRYPAPAADGPRRYAPLVATPARTAGPSSSRRASCRRAKITVKSAPYGRVLRMALRATLECDLPRQNPAPIKEDENLSIRRVLSLG